MKKVLFNLLAFISLSSFASEAPRCPSVSSAVNFKANAEIISVSSISSIKPIVQNAFNNSIAIRKCALTLRKGDPIQIVDYFQTKITGYSYIKVRYEDAGLLKEGWIYSGRAPRRFQKVKLDKSHQWINKL